MTVVQADEPSAASIEATYASQSPPSPLELTKKPGVEKGLRLRPSICPVTKAFELPAVGSLARKAVRHLAV